MCEVLKQKDMYIDCDLLNHYEKFKQARKADGHDGVPA